MRFFDAIFRKKSQTIDVLRKRLQETSEIPKERFTAVERKNMKLNSLLFTVGLYIAGLIVLTGVVFYNVYPRYSYRIHGHDVYCFDKMTGDLYIKKYGGISLEKIEKKL